MRQVFRKGIVRACVRECVRACVREELLTFSLRYHCYFVIRTAKSTQGRIKQEERRLDLKPKIKNKYVQVGK